MASMLAACCCGSGPCTIFTDASPQNVTATISGLTMCPGMTGYTGGVNVLPFLSGNSTTCAWSTTLINGGAWNCGGSGGANDHGTTSIPIQFVIGVDQTGVFWSLNAGQSFQANYFDSGIVYVPGATSFAQVFASAATGHNSIVSGFCICPTGNGTVAAHNGRGSVIAGP